MPTWPVLSRDVSSQVRKKAKTKQIHLEKALDFSVTLEVDKETHQVLSADKSAQDDLSRAADSAYGKLVPALVNILQKADIEYDRVAEDKKKAVIQKLEKDYQKMFRAVAGNTEKAVRATWTGFKKEQTTLAERDAKIILDTTKSFADLLQDEGEAAPALSTTQLLKSIRDAKGGYEAIHKAARAAETLEKSFKTSLDLLRKRYADNKKSLMSGGAKDGTQPDPNKILGKDFFATIDDVMKDIGEYDKQVQALDRASRDFGKTLDKILDRTKDLRKQSGSRPDMIISAALKALESRTNDGIDQNKSLQNSLDIRKKNKETVTKALTEIKKSEPDKWKLIQKGSGMVGPVLGQGVYLGIKSKLDDIQSIAEGL
ncbi:hypothetical protein [Rhodospirillum sp. A1_3_36]|uniref:hypothetical protein n=1 Tax=Rhodospirillum sp. A1_3_36 TaxID=3391666 RepID=UPI0039A41040